MEDDIHTYRKALEDFKRARKKAAMQRFWAGIRGESLDLLPYDEISAKLHAVARSTKELSIVPLNKIVGSVGRTADFNRDFSPLNDSDNHRWANVKTYMTSPVSTGLPPVELYRIGDAYFVLDGNHRVSVAKDMGAKDIEAYVTVVKTKVPINSEITPEELIRKSGYADFLAQTHLDEYLPGVNFELHEIQHYPLLKEHIDVHRYYMGEHSRQAVSEQEAALDWYDHVYLPVVALIQASGMEQLSQPLSITDLYLYTLDQQTRLQEEMQMPVSTSNALEFSATSEGKKLVNLETMRVEELTSVSRAEALFKDIFVAVSPDDEDIVGLQQAILVNQNKLGNIRGLHVLPEKMDPAKENPDTERLKEKFSSILAENKMHGRLIEVEGNVAPTLTKLSLLSDLLVLKQSHPIPGVPLDRLSHGLLNILGKIKRPVFIVKEDALPVENILLLYDGSLKSRQGLYISAYFVAAYQARLTILTADNNAQDLMAEVQFAKQYLDNLHLYYDYKHLANINIVTKASELVEELDISTLICGGFSGSGIVERLFGSKIDAILQKIDIPVLICQ